MKYIVHGAFLLFAGLACATTPSGRKQIDRTMATIYHPEKVVLVCASDLKPDLSERVPSVQEAVLKELIVLDGEKLQIPVSDQEVDKALVRVQEHLEKTRGELIEFFKEQGYSLEEAKKELSKSMMVENVMEARIRTKAHASTKEIEQYHAAHPDIIYTVEQAFVPFNGGLPAVVRNHVEQQMKEGTFDSSVTWNQLGAVHDRDVADAHAAIRTAQPGKSFISSETLQGVVVLRLQEKKVTPFEERKQSIASTLGQQKFAQVQGSYQTKLIDEAHIRYHGEAAPAA